MSRPSKNRLETNLNQILAELRVAGSGSVASCYDLADLTPPYFRVLFSFFFGVAWEMPSLAAARRQSKRF